MRLLLLGVVAWTSFGCGTGSDQQTASPAERGQSPTATFGEATAGAVAEPSNRDNFQTVTLVGCLKGPASSSAVGTSGANTRTRMPANADPLNQRFTLVDATAASPATAGVGAQGAGASGGPLVSGKASFELDGVPATARDAVNKQVQITGRLDIAAPVVPAALRTTAPPPAGRAGTPTDATGETSIAQGAVPSEEATGWVEPRTSATTGSRRLVVDTIQVTASECARP